MGYTLRDTIRLEVTLADPDTGTAVDAADIVCTVQPPAGNPAETPAVVQVATGRYRALFASTVAGEHWYAFASQSLGIRKEGAFVVDEDHVT